ncbi:MAG: PhoH family protein [Atopobiaceae bacterium]|jgi:phosphate starvation-inducible PhoH-like protein
MEPTNIRLTIPDVVDPTVLMGPADTLLRHIEQSLQAMITVRGNQISISGDADVVAEAATVFSRLIHLIEQGETPGVADVDLILGQVAHGAAPTGATDIIHTYKGRAIRPKTAGQKRYIEAIRQNSITFGEGPAGTGKTYLAMAMALAALKRRDVSRIVLARPVVEAGESLGYLPGTLEEKLDPYVRPLFDALFDILDRERGMELIEQGVIEIAPLAFMRGRTFNDAFVILDEAQNTTPSQMKMFLTRLGFHSKFVVTGDFSQRDVRGSNGLMHARQVLANVDDIAFVALDRNDIVRHSLVARIVDAYNEAEKDAREARSGKQRSS